MAEHYRPLFELMQGADLVIQYLNLPNANELVGKPRALPNRRAGNVADQMHKVVAEIAREAGVKRLVSTHLNPAIDQDGVRERVIAEMSEILKGVLIWGEDLMEITL